MSLFVDLIECGERATNDALELLCKAAHDHDGDIWAPMDSPLLARLVELFTQRGLDRLDAVRTEILAWQSGALHTTGDRIVRPGGLMDRWTQSELSLVRIYLEHLPPADWTLEDHMLAVDATVQRYMPADDMRTEAEWLSTRASLMGRVQASMTAVTAAQADALLSGMPSTPAEAVAAFGGERAQRATMEFAATRCAENVRNITNDVRHRMRAVVGSHVADRELGLPATQSSLETKLLDQFGMLNRDWRRIAVTEAGEAQTAGYVASVPAGTKVKRVEQYKNACAFCRKIDGRVMECVDAAAPDKNPETQIWPGKTNVGRSASPRKRVGQVFQEREPDEMWQVPVGLVHPHCRGRWIPTIADRPGDSTEFGDWMRARLAAMPAKEPK